MSNQKIIAAFIRSAVADPTQLDAQLERIHSAAQVHGHGIDQEFRDLDELRRAVAGGGISTLWLTSHDRLWRGTEGFQVLEENMAAGVEVRTSEMEITPLHLRFLRALTNAKNEEFLVRIRRGKEAARLNRMAQATS